MPAKKGAKKTLELNRDHTWNRLNDLLAIPYPPVGEQEAIMTLAKRVVKELRLLPPLSNVPCDVELRLLAENAPLWGAFHIHGDRPVVEVHPQQGRSAETTSMRRLMCTLVHELIHVAVHRKLYRERWLTVELLPAQDAHGHHFMHVLAEVKPYLKGLRVNPMEDTNWLY